MSAEGKSSHKIGAETAEPSALDPLYAQALSALRLRFSGSQQPPGVPIGPAPALAQLGLIQLEMAEAYLLGARRIIDLWRNSVRSQQDQFLAGWRAQLAPQMADSDQPDLPANSVALRVNGVDRSQRPVAARKRNRVDHTETTVLAREH